MKLKEWIALWQEVYDKPAVRPSTYQAHGYLLKNHIIPRLGEMELTDITESIVQRFLNECHDHGNLRRNEPLSQETIRHICVILSGILKQAVSDGYIAKNPVKNLRYHTSKKVQAETLSEAEREEYLDAAAELGYLPIFLLALEHGLRQRELIALKWGDLDTKRGTLTIYMDRVVERRALVDLAELDAEIERQQEETQVVAELVKAAVQENASTAQSQDAYLQKYEALTKRYETAAAELERLKGIRAERERQDQAIALFIRTLKKQPEVLDAWSDTIWTVMVERVLVHRNGGLTFQFYNGSEIRIKR